MSRWNSHTILLPFMYFSSLIEHHKHHCYWQQSPSEAWCMMSCNYVMHNNSNLDWMWDMGIFQWCIWGVTFLGCDIKKFGRWVPTFCSNLQTPSSPWRREAADTCETSVCFYQTICVTSQRTVMLNSHIMQCTVKIKNLFCYWIINWDCRAEYWYNTDNTVTVFASSCLLKKRKDVNWGLYLTRNDDDQQCDSLHSIFPPPYHPVQF
jgi:hypothetical protein